MNHKFTPSQIDVSKCGVCKHGVMAHTSMATCECCPTISPVEIYKTMLMCPACILKEQNLETKSASEADSRLIGLLERSKEVDYSVQMREDIFNVETVPFNELIKSIELDATITNKPYAVAEAVKERILHFSKVIFDKQDEIKIESTKQRFWQEQANQLASKLRVEEREKLKLHDINYKPPTNGKVSKPKAITTKKSKFDPTELVTWANKGGWPMSVLQTTCVARNMTPEQAYNFLKEKGL